jgi:predicted ATP-grasp superfamily ATP-dependent carboligase
MIPLPSILICEYVSGGGWPDPLLPEGLANEGLAMLEALLKDFRAWGGCKTITTRDRRLAHIPLPADSIIDLEPGQHYSTLSQLASQCIAALVIAPESNGILASLSALIESRGACLLGSSPSGIYVTANKWNCHQLFSSAGLPTPETWYVKVHETGETAEKIGFPLVIKPIDGVGCKGVNLIINPDSTQFALSKNIFPENRLLLQRYIQGVHASVSLLVIENDTLSLSLNRQTIEIGSPFSYKGGEVPFTCARQQEAISLAKQAAALVPGLKGYIGVDILITDQGCYLVEINPRITTAYIGLRSVININLAEAIWTIATNGVLPKKITLSGKTIFRKEKVI